MKRVPEVIDCWYDSGAMPFAQWGYPNQLGSKERFKSQFPADFISEAIDQTRGWFYSQLAISTILFAEDTDSSDDTPFTESLALEKPHPYPHPFRNCIVLGHMLGEDGQKMSKSKRNYLPPNEIFDKYGADALRWYFFASQPPWTTIRYSEQAIKDSIPEFLLRLWNVYSFFVIYANIDGFQPEGRGARSEGLANSPPPYSGEGLGEGAEVGSTANPHPNPPPRGEGVIERSEIDRWILSELNRTCAAVVERMDAYDNYGACQRITEFVDALSNWYVRRSRDRFWMADKQATEKLDAYRTLYECLLTTCKLIAPFTPFIAEAMWRNLSSPQPPAPSPFPNSVHLANYPTGDALLVDVALSERMNLVREITSLGRNARNVANLKVRQPLAKVEVVLVDTQHQPWLEEHVDLIAEELNVKAVDFTTHGEQYISYSVVPNFKRLGPRLGKHLPLVKGQLQKADGATLLAELKSTGKIELKLPDGETISLDTEDIEVRLQAKEGWAAAQGKGCVVVLATELTPELVAEGMARDLVRVIQDHRKETGCEFTDRIEVGIVTESTELRAAAERFRDYLAAETLAARIQFTPIEGVEPVRVRVGEHEALLYVRVVRP